MGSKIETVFGMIVLVFPAIVMMVGGYLLWGQHQKLTRYQPVDAIILAKQIGERSTDDGTRYYPIIEYEYHVDAVRHTSDEVFPVRVNSSHSWAARVIAPFNVGDPVQAFYNPDRPSDAYLLREASFFPYIFVLFPMVFVTIGIAILGYGRGRTALQAPLPLRGGGFSMRPQLPLRRRVLIAGLMAGLWYGIGGMAIIHYYTIAEPPYGRLAHVASAIYLVLGLIPLSMLTRRRRLARTLSDAIVYTDAARFAPGHTIAVVAEQQVRRKAHISEIQIALVQQVHKRSSRGKKTTHTTTRRDFDRHTFPQNRDVLPGDSLSASANLIIPTHAPATSSASGLANPLYDYYIEVVTCIPGQRDYTGRFAFCLETASGPLKGETASS